MDYKELLEYSFKHDNYVNECHDRSRLAYLSEHVFDFTTYDSEMDELFARKAVEVSKAIYVMATYEYISFDEDSHKWYLIMCNMPFFAHRLEWGASIRGAWWINSAGFYYVLDSCGLWAEGEQIVEMMHLSGDEWAKFIRAVIDFAQPEMKVEEIDG